MATDFIFEPLTPLEVIDAIAKKSTDAGWAFDWRDVAPEDHAAAFYIAKMKDQGLRDFMKAEVEAMIQGGLTEKQFRERIIDRLMAEGWWGKKMMVDPATGEEREVQLGSLRRIRTIYYTNLRQAQQAGLWERIQASKVGLPYLRYHTMEDEKVRAEHGAWNDIVLPVDHPFWLTHFPMNGWGCRCYVTQMTAGMVARAGLKITGEKELAFYMGKSTLRRNKRTGIMETGYPGIDPGFAYNPGVARLDHLGALAEAEVNKAAKPPVPLAALLRRGANGSPDEVATLARLIKTAELKVPADLDAQGRQTARLEIVHDGVVALIGKIKFNVIGNDLVIGKTDKLARQLRRLGIGRALYSKLGLRAARRGGVLMSDWTVSEEARRVYFGLLTRGWRVEFRNGIVRGEAAFELLPGKQVGNDAGQWYALETIGETEPISLFTLRPPIS